MPQLMQLKPGTSGHTTTLLTTAYGLPEANFADYFLLTATARRQAPQQSKMVAWLTLALQPFFMMGEPAVVVHTPFPARTRSWVKHGIIRILPLVL